MIKITAISTKIDKIIQIGEVYIILEDYYKFEGISNLYSIDKNNNIIWFAEIPIENDKYVNINIFNNSIIESTTWNGFKVHIDTQSGKIINKIYSK